jgi:hypothetical protein
METAFPYKASIVLLMQEKDFKNSLIIHEAIIQSWVRN